jgi:hypothetical protein
LSIASAALNAVEESGQRYYVSTATSCITVCLLTVGDSSCPFAENAGSAAFDRTDPAIRRSAWRVEILTEAPVATELPGRH